MNRGLLLLCFTLLLATAASERKRHDNPPSKRRKKGKARKESTAISVDVKGFQYEKPRRSNKGESKSKSLENHDKVPTAIEEYREEVKFIRCRMCGARIAVKSDYVPMHDTSKAIDSRLELSLGENSIVHTFAHSNHPDIELAAFKSTMAKESTEFYEETVSNFDGYSSNDLYCSRCDHFVGWSFMHNDYRKCLLENLKALDKSEDSAPLNARISGKQKNRVQEQEKLVQEALKGECIVVVMGWWSYQICYRIEVRQFHAESDGTKTNDWSMGVYVPQTDARYRKYKHEDDLIQYYANGQPCEENAAKRSTKVIYTCCHETTDDEIKVKSIKEPSLCYYEIKVCIANLCQIDSKRNEVDPKHSLKADEKCKYQIEQIEKHQKPASFFAYLWSTVVSDDSSELDWMRTLKVII